MECNLKIPRVATAVLVLGGACGEDEPSPLDADGTDASSARKEAVAKAVCEHTFECDDRARSTDLASCTASIRAYFDEYVTADATDDCVDALLDYYACYASLSCEETDDDASDSGRDCAFETRFDERCEGQFNE